MIFSTGVVDGRLEDRDCVHTGEQFGWGTHQQFYYTIMPNLPINLCTIPNYDNDNKINAGFNIYYPYHFAHTLFILLLIKSILQGCYLFIAILFAMKKVRVSKKDPTRTLKLFEILPNNRYEHRRELTGPQPRNNISTQLGQQSHRESTIHSHRYNNEDVRRSGSKKYSLSPREGTGKILYQIERPEGLKTSLRNSNQLRKSKYRSSQRSPYLERRIQNKSDHKLFLGTQQLNRSQHKIYKPIRLNSLEHRVSSQKDDKDRKSQQMLREAKKLMQTGEIRKSIFMLKSVLKNDPTNIDALYVAMMNWFNADEFDKTLAYVRKLHELRPNYSCQLYLVWAKIIMKLGEKGKHDQALAKLNEGLQYFPGEERIISEKGSILLGVKKYAKAAECFEDCIKMDQNSIQARQRLIVVYSGMGDLDKVLRLVQELMGLVRPNSNSRMLRQIEAETLLKLKRYEEIIEKYHECDEPTLSFNVGVSYYKLKDHLKAYLVLESALQTQNCAKAVRFMLLIKIKENDFYEAMHLLARCQYLNIDPKALELENTFIDGVICLMRRHMTQGVQKLSVVGEAEQKGEPLNQFTKEIFPIVHTYIAYGLYCLGFYEKCWENYELQIQKYPQYSFEGMEYNILMIKAYLSFKREDIQASQAHLHKAILLNQKRLQPVFCSAICEAEKGRRSKITDLEGSYVGYRQALKYLVKCVEMVHKIQNNSSSNVFYHKSLIHGYLQEWKDAIICIDEAIERSEENDWRHFYARAIIMASIHNFAQAINDSTIAINLRPSEADPYFIRSSCFQIQGEGNNAFKDLQTYITMRPNDKQIHKFAGKLLFENGAFEDALIAFEHEPIEKDIKNIDAFLTKSKTFFLIGQFQQASLQMKIVHELQPSPAILFDMKLMGIVGKIVDINSNYGSIIKTLDHEYAQQENVYSKQQIFKKTELNTMKALCYFYQGEYVAAIDQLALAIRVKQKTVLKEALLEGSAREDEKDTKVFCSQMRFNIVVCSLVLGDEERALKQAYKIEISKQQPYFENYLGLMNLLNGKFILGKEMETKTIQVFPNRNKISNYIPQVCIMVKGIQISTKLCIPFPKVEPPEIFPVFDVTLLNFDITNVDRKPEAPWIHREENTVNFTGKVQKYSRLEIEDSVKDQSCQSELEVNNSHISLSSISTRRAHLIPKSARRAVRNRNPT